MTDEIEEKETFEDKVISVINKLFGEVKSDKPVIKQFHEDEMIAYEPLYIAAGEVDLHGWTIDLEDVHAMVKSLNETKPPANWFHKTDTKDFEIIKAWVNECECTIGDHLVPEGQPIAKVQFYNKEAWEMRKSGEITGLSINARAKSLEDIDDV